MRERGRLPVIACCRDVCEMCRQTAGLITFLQCLFQPWIGDCAIAERASSRNKNSRSFMFLFCGLGEGWSEINLSCSL